VATAAYGLHGIRWSPLVNKIALPLLLLSPVLALALTVVMIRILRSVQKHYSADVDCACTTFELNPVPAGMAMDGSASVDLSLPSFGIKVAKTEECATDRTAFLGISAHQLHWLTSGPRASPEE
jgi:hypothetical protein